ncbi:MAG: glycosyltransferase family 61 protein [Pseudomonadota bacterium]
MATQFSGPELARHLDRIKRPDRRTIINLSEVDESAYALRTSYQPLHPARGVNPHSNQFEPPIQPQCFFLLKLQDAYIGDNVVFDDGQYFSFGRWWAGPDASLYRETETVSHVEAAVLVSAWMGAAFQHFILDGIAPLAMVLDWLELPQNKNIRIASHYKDAPFARWFWQIMGLTERIVDKPINALERYVLHANHVYFPHFSPVSPMSRLYPRATLRPVQQRLGLRELSPRDLIIYVTRQDTNRSVTGEEILLNRLGRIASEQDLKLVVFKSVGDWDADRALFKRAKIVMGPHGAGLANIVFCQPETHVVEFITPSDGRVLDNPGRYLGYYGLSQAAGHHYWNVEPESFDFDAPAMSVSFPDVERIMERILSDGDGF